MTFGFTVGWVLVVLAGRAPAAPAVLTGIDSLGTRQSVSESRATGTGDLDDQPKAARPIPTTQVMEAGHRIPSQEGTGASRNSVCDGANRDRLGVSPLLPEESGTDSCGALEAQAGLASRGLAAAVAAVHAAQCILSRRCAGPLSLALAESDIRSEELAGAARDALALLDRASRHLGEAQGDPDTKRELADRIQSLRAFGGVFAALAGAGHEESRNKQLLTACNELAPCLDDASVELVESAKLWLSLGYRRAGRPDRALQIARPVIAAPTSRRIGFLMRLQRCRALGETGNHAAGIALCQRLAVRVDAWLAEEDEATRAKAADTVRFLRMGLLRGWARELRRLGKDERADAAEAYATKLQRSEGDSLPSDRWLALEVAIAGLPEQASPTTSAAVGEDG